MTDLDKVRVQIQHVDQQLEQLLDRRFELSEQVAQSKMQSGGAVYNKEREEFLLSRLSAPNLLEKTRLFSAVIRMSRQRQYTMLAQNGLWNGPETHILPADTPVLTVGPAGSYSQAAAAQMYSDRRPRLCQTFDQVFAQVRQGGCIGVIPLENSTAGTVNDVYNLLARHNLYIIKDYHLPINHLLCTAQPGEISDIKKIVSHQQAVMQCSEFIAKHSLETSFAQTTAQAAQLVKERNDPALGVICSRQAAQENRLFVMSEAVANAAINQTRFIALYSCPVEAQSPTHCTLNFILPHTVGSLSQVLSIFSDFGFNLSKIVSLPEPQTPWEYSFFVDVSLDGNHRALNALIFMLESELPFVKVLGIY